MRRIVSTLALLSITIALAACHSVSLSKADAVKVGDVDVVWLAPLPETAFYNGLDSGLAAAAGGAVGAVAYSLVNDKPTAIANFVRDQKIYLEGMIGNEFKRQLALKPEFRDRIRPGAASRFALRVVAYGLAGSGPLSFDHRPYLALEAQLLDPSGRIIWQQRDYVGSEGDAPALSFDAFLASPESFKAAFQPAIRGVVRLELDRL